MSKTYYVLNNAPGADITGEDRCGTPCTNTHVPPVASRMRPAQYAHAVRRVKWTWLHVVSTCRMDFAF